MEITIKTIMIIAYLFISGLLGLVWGSLFFLNGFKYTINSELEYLLHGKNSFGYLYSTICITFLLPSLIVGVVVYIIQKLIVLIYELGISKGINKHG